MVMIAVRRGDRIVLVKIAAHADCYGFLAHRRVDHAADVAFRGSFLGEAFEQADFRHSPVTICELRHRQAANDWSLIHEHDAVPSSFNHPWREQTAHPRHIKEG